METRLDLCLKTLDKAVPMDDETRVILTLKELHEISNQIKLLKESVQKVQRKPNLLMEASEPRNEDDSDSHEKNYDEETEGEDDEDSFVPPPAKRSKKFLPPVSNDKDLAETLVVSPALRKLLSYLNGLPSCYRKGDSALPSKFDVLQGKQFDYYGLHSAQCKLNLWNNEGIDKWLRRRAPVLKVHGLNPALIWLIFTSLYDGVL